jgi:hypothetical protein
MLILTHYETAWEPWFAWYPVHMQVRGQDHQSWGWVWLETVTRRRTGAMWDYKPRGRV